ncbi:conserved Plasmodium protein, unknown function [Plasmodium relictum]|uniref:Ribosomal RNA methyltransferase FtsJ domain-containing protein n=1 Tax=Plasmodium relictum TaxID=85471 RepID=A0A1J1HC66_PLARL|nr:conserved Plasmodium protein, unknown function [Plasmodium relictum]CRH03089.1 conserved Plasmodium protein, unknown function [Plasmodium relictum]
MNHIFTFETNLNDIFTGDDVKNSEKNCDYCIKRKRICKCDTIKKELGSEKKKDLEEFSDLKKYYNEICEKIVDKYKDVVNRFEYDKEIVRYIKKNRINNEIENEDWLYFYELLKDRKVLERCIDTKSNKELVLFNSFHLDEEANFISCLNYYIKVNKYNNVNHNWMGMSENPFSEYVNNNEILFQFCDNRENQDDNKKNCSHINIPSNIEEKENMDISLGYKKFYPLYYLLYIQDNEKWISGINNSGNILHLENIDYIWNKTVRENNKIKLFHLITSNSVKMDNTDYKLKKRNENLTTENIEIDKILCVSQLVCALGMLNIGGFFIIKVKLSFDNFLLSVFSILSICFKKLEVYRPSCCYLRNVVFLIGIHFNGITSIFLSSLNNWVQSAQKEITYFYDNKNKDNRNEYSDINKTTNYLNSNIIPRKWIKNSFFQEYKNCIKHFIDYQIYYLKKCINVSNTNLIKKNIENTKNTYISKFFEENKIMEIKRKDKLLHKLVNIYEDKELLYQYDQTENENDLLSKKDRENNSESCDSCYTCSEIIYSNKKISKIKNIVFHIENKKAYFENIYKKNLDCNNNVKRYSKQIATLLKKIKYKNKKENPGKKELFQLDKEILKERVFALEKSSFLKEENEFQFLLQKQAYLNNRNWFKTYLQNDISNFEKPFYLKKSIFRDILKCRYYLYYNNCDIHINSLKQILKQYEPLSIRYINYELYCNVIDCLFVLKNCANCDIFKDSKFLENFLVISAESIMYNFFSKFENGYYVSLENENSNNNPIEYVTDEHRKSRVSFISVEKLYETRKPYKIFSELLINKLKKKNICSLIYIDLNTIFPNFVHLVQKELKIKNYFVASLIIAFNYLMKSGNMILRLSSVLTFFTAGLIYILFCSFEKIEFFLPPSCDDINLDFYIYCYNFNENYVYRHYIQYIWDVIICNKYLDEKNFNKEDNKKGGMKEKKRNCDIYFSTPIYFIMNKYFVLLLKKFNSFYFKHHINICLNFMKEPKYFYHNKALIKCLLTHFFKAYVIQNKSFRNVYRSIIINSDEFDERKDETEDDEIEDSDDEKNEKSEDEKELNDPKENEGEIRSENNNEKEISRSGHFKSLFDLKENEKDRENIYENSSSDSNYSIVYEYKNVPSEISISETVWESS